MNPESYVPLLWFAVIVLQFAVISIQFAVISLQFGVIDLQNFGLLWNDLQPFIIALLAYKLILSYYSIKDRWWNETYCLWEKFLFSKTYV